MNQRIDIYGNVETENAVGEETVTFQKLESIWADIIPQTGALQRQQADTILTNVTHKIKVRYGSVRKIITKNGVENVNVLKDMEIRFRNHRFEVKYAIDPYFKREKVEIFVQEVLS